MMPQFEDQTPAPECWDCERVIYDARDHGDECSDPRAPEAMIEAREEPAITEQY